MDAHAPVPLTGASLVDTHAPVPGTGTPVTDTRAPVPGTGTPLMGTRTPVPITGEQAIGIRASVPGTGASPSRLRLPGDVARGRLARVRDLDLPAKGVAALRSWRPVGCPSCGAAAAGQRGVRVPPFETAEKQIPIAIVPMQAPHSAPATNMIIGASPRHADHSAERSSHVYAP